MRKTGLGWVAVLLVLGASLGWLRGQQSSRWKNYVPVPGGKYSKGDTSCTYTLSPGSASYPVGGGSGCFTVNTQAGCAWTATVSSSNLDLITINSGFNGVGSGTVCYSVSANTGALRSGTITVATQIFTVNQAGNGCTYGISPTSAGCAASGCSGSISVTTQAGCAWTAVSNNQDWIIITGGANSTGPGAVGYNVLANTGPERSGTITVAGKTFTINQCPASCTYAISPTSATLPASGGNGGISVSASSCCSWTATVSDDSHWITLNGNTSGIGTGMVSYAAPAYSSGTRTGTITVAGQTFTLTQSSSSGCYFELTSTEAYYPHNASAYSFFVGTPPGCTWQISGGDTWLWLNSIPMTGPGYANFSLDPNNSPDMRTGYIYVGGQTYTVHQRGCRHSLPVTSAHFTSSMGTGSFIVSNPDSCNWNASSNVDWITLNGTTSGIGTGTVSYSVAANTGTVARNGTITVAGPVPSLTFTVNQDAPATTCVLTDQTIMSTVTFGPCDTLAAGPAFRIEAPGVVTFRAATHIILRNGFSVGAGAIFHAILDPAAPQQPKTDNREQQ